MTQRRSWLPSVAMKLVASPFSIRGVNIACRGWPILCWLSVFLYVYERALASGPEMCFLFLLARCCCASFPLYTSNDTWSWTERKKNRHPRTSRNSPNIKAGKRGENGTKTIEDIGRDRCARCRGRTLHNRNLGVVSRKSREMISNNNNKLGK